MARKTNAELQQRIQELKTLIKLWSQNAKTKVN